MAIKVFYIISDINKALAFEWIATQVDKKKIDLRFILIGNTESELGRFLQSRGMVFYTIPYRSKMDLPVAWFRVISILRSERPQVVHTHLYVANVIGITASWVLRIPKRIYTRHHGTIHHDYFPRTVWIDKLVNSLSTHIIAPSTNLSRILIDREGVSPTKVVFIPHGFDLDYFGTGEEAGVEALREKYLVPRSAYPVIGVISRFTEWKGIQYIIPAFREVLREYPDARLVLANANGDYATQIRRILDSLPPGSFTLIPFENDIASLYRMFNVFVHTPVDPFSESFGQTYVEALAAGVPAVFTLSGIAPDFVQDGRNAVVVPFRDAMAIKTGIIRILAHEALRNQIISQGMADVKERFPIARMILELEALYQETT